MLYQLIIAQVLAVAYTIFSVKQEKPINSMMRDYVPPSRLLSKEYHQFGFYMTVVFCASLSVAWWPLGLLALAWYGLLFDLLISKKLGSESWWDRQFKKYLGKHALIIKSVGIALLIIATNYFLIKTLNQN